MDITTKTQLEAQKADANKNVLFKELGANKDSLWFNVRCAYTVIDKKNYLLLHQKDLSAELKDGPKAMKIHNYIDNQEIDFPFRDFGSSNKIIINNGGVTSKNIFLRGITAFVDYIPDAAKYEYFKYINFLNIFKFNYNIALKNPQLIFFHLLFSLLL